MMDKITHNNQSFEIDHQAIPTPEFDYSRMKKSAWAAVAREEGRRRERLRNRATPEEAIILFGREGCKQIWLDKKDELFESLRFWTNPSEETRSLFSEEEIEKNARLWVSRLNYLAKIYLKAVGKKPKPIRHGKLTEEEIQAARESPLEDLYSGVLRRVRSQLVGLCPVHDERTPSFYIYDDNHFHCFACGFHGLNAIDFVMQTEDISFSEAVRFIL